MYGDSGKMPLQGQIFLSKLRPLIQRISSLHLKTNNIAEVLLELTGKPLEIILRYILPIVFQISFLGIYTNTQLQTSLDR